MNAKRIRSICILALVCSLLGITATPALADQPVKYDYTTTWNNVLTGVCDFDIDVESYMEITEIDFFNNSGAISRIYWHTNEQDTFIANGKTLVGIPFTMNAEILFDSSGQTIHVNSSGVFEKIPLPDGSLFVSAGRVDFMDYPGVYFILSPDRGNPGNTAGFCAALAPE